MARAMTAPELAYVRGPRQRTRLFVDADVPPVVFACQANQSFSSLDMVLEVTYNNVTAGAYGDVLAGMTLLVGSSAGAGDLGECRIRKAADATKLYIGLTSEIPWADDVYLTVLDEFRLWAKPLAVNAGGAVLVDGETLYSDQNTDFAPVIIAGPARRVARLEGAYVDVAFDLSDSWVPGSSISSRSVSAPDSLSVADGTTDAPVVRYEAEGRYRIGFTAVAANGKSSTAYRTVRIYSDADPLLTVFGPPEGSGDQEDGGWQMRLNVYLPQSTLSVIRKHAMITLVAEDWYDETKVSIGPVAGSENVVAIGWLASSEIRANPRTGGAARLDVMGPQYWLANIGASNLELDNSTSTPSAWNEVQDLTADKALHHIVTWRSTIAAVMDVHPSGDTRVADRFPNADGTLMGQLAAIGLRILAAPRCDRYGRLFLRIDQQFVSEGSRSGIPVVMTIEKDDWRDELGIRENIEQVAQLIQVASLHGAGPTQAIYSLATGHIVKHFGAQAASTEADLIVASQAQANEIAGLRLARANREFEFEIPIAQNNRMVDICPEQYVALGLTAGDTPRGIEFDGRIVVRHVELKYDAKSGFLSFEWSGEQETFAENAINGDIPVGDEADDLPGLPSLPPLPPLPAMPAPPFVPPDPGGVGNAVVLLKDYGVFYTKTLTADTPAWLAMNSGLPTDKNTIRELLVTASGKLYCRTDEDVYYAPEVGAAWTLVFDADTEVDNPNGFPFPQSYQVEALGVAPDEDDNVLIVASALFTIFTDCIPYSFKGTGATGFVRTGGTDGGAGIVTPDSAARGGFIEYLGEGAWAYTFSPSGGVTRVCRLNSVGRSPSNAITFASGDTHVLSHKPASSEAVLAKLNTSGATKRMGITVDHGLTWTTLATIPVAMYGELALTFETLACNYDGTKILIGVEDVLGLRRSSDFGATWGSTLVAGSVTAVWFMGDDAAINPESPTEYWIVAKQGDIGLTSDFGDSFRDITGDLLTWAPLFRVRLIRTFQDS